jgi:hypothetical protein
LSSVDVHCVVGTVSHQVGIANVVFHKTTTQDDRSSSLSEHSHAVDLANILHNVDDETRIFEGVQVQHVTNRSISQRGTEDRDVILITPLEI